MFHCANFFLNLTWIALEFKCSTALCDLLAKGLVVRLLLSDSRVEIQISWYGTENVRIIDSHPHTLNSLSFTPFIVLFEGTPRSNSISNSMNFNDFLFWLLSHPHQPHQPDWHRVLSKAELHCSAVVQKLSRLKSWAEKYQQLLSMSSLYHSVPSPVSTISCFHMHQS